MLEINSRELSASFLKGDVNLQKLNDCIVLVSVDDFAVPVPNAMLLPPP